MQTWDDDLKGIIAFISAAIGSFFGLACGAVGATVGLISGFLVGYYYVHFTLKIKSRNTLLRIFQGTLNGALAGLISGISVHIPGLFAQQKHGLFGIAYMGYGAMFGVVIGTVFGFIVSCIIAFRPRGKESE